MNFCWEESIRRSRRNRRNREVEKPLKLKALATRYRTLARVGGWCALQGLNLRKETGLFMAFHGFATLGIPMFPVGKGLRER